MAQTGARTVKSGGACQGCLPQQVGKCVNTVRTQPPQAVGTPVPLSPKNSFPGHTQPSPPPNAAPPLSLPSRSSPYVEFRSSTELLLSRSPHTSVPETPPNCDVAPELPAFPPSAEPIVTWGNQTGPELTKLLDTTYDEVVHWRQIAFLL